MTAEEISSLLDWFDKVRVGLWLADQRLNGNPFGIEPKFHMTRRVRLRDRALIFIPFNSTEPRLNWITNETSCFHFSPVAFSLVVNNLVCVNISHHSLCDKRLGFPFLQASAMDKNGNICGEVVRGTQRMVHPVNLWFSDPQYEVLYQPIFGQSMQGEAEDLFRSSEYVGSHSIDLDQGIGRVFIQSNSSVRYLDTRWKPTTKAVEMDHAIKLAARTTWNIQLEQMRRNIEKTTPPLKTNLRFLYRQLKKRTIKAISQQNQVVYRVKQPTTQQSD
jgi:hypothetical protein